MRRATSRLIPWVLGAVLVLGAALLWSRAGVDSPNAADPGIIGSEYPSAADVPMREGKPSLAGAPRVERHGAAGTAREPVVFGRVESAADGTPVRNATVRSFAFRGRVRLADATTDADGRFEIAETKGDAAAVQVVVTHPDFAPATRSGVVPSSEALVVRMERAAWITGRVVFAEPSERRDVRVRATEQAPGADGAVPFAVAQSLLPDDLRAWSEAPLEGESFRLGPLAPGTYVVVVIANGAAPFEFPAMRGSTGLGVRVEAGETRDLGTLEVPAVGWLTARVMDAKTEEPIRNAQFHGLADLGDARTFVDVPSRPTERPGEYLVAYRRESGRAPAERLRAAAPGYAASPVVETIFVDGIPLARLGRFATLRADVREASGSPLARALVVVMKSQGRDVLGHATADDDGLAVIESLLPYRELEVVAYPPTLAGEHARVSLVLEGGETREIVLGGSSGTGVHGTITFEGRLVTGALVTLDADGRRRMQARTGRDGRFAFQGVPWGPATVHVGLGEHGASVERFVEIRRDEMRTLPFALVHHAQGRVVAEEATPDPHGLIQTVADEQVLAVDGGGEGWTSRATIRGDGSFALLLPDVAAEWTLSLEDVRGVVADPVTYAAHPGAAPPTLVARFGTHDGRFTLRALDEAGRPLVGATFSAWYGNTREWAQADAEGVLHRRKLAMGRYVLEASHDAYVPQRIEVVLTRERPEAVHDLRLEPASAVRVVGFSNPSRARDAGMREGDLILQYGGVRIDNARALGVAIASTPPDKSIDVTVERGGRTTTVSMAGGQMGVEIVNARATGR